jgi:hypothetical protein
MRKALANLLFIFVGLPLTLSALFLAAARPWALDRDTYKRFVEDDRLYAALQAPEIAARAPRSVELRPAGSGGGAAIALDGPSLAAAAQKDLPWPAIRTAASGAVDAVLDSVEGRVPGPPELDLRTLKAALKRQAPALGRDYLANAARTGATLPAAADSPSELSALLGAYVDALPDTATPGEPGQAAAIAARMPLGVLSRGPGAAGGLTQALLNRMTATTLAFSALALAALGALGGTGLASRLSRAGKYLLIPSVLVLVAGAVLAIPGGLILQGALPEEARTMLIGTAGAQLRDYLASALGPIARTFFVTGLVGASLGGVLASARRYAEPKELEE